MGAVVNLSMSRAGCARFACSRWPRPWRSPRPCRDQPAASNLWLVAGGACATLRGDCQTCEEDFPYRHAAALLVDVGYRVNPRMDAGVEVFWMPIDTSQGTIRTTHFDAVAQFRPWASHGFFLKGGAGMAFVKNFVDVLGPDRSTRRGCRCSSAPGGSFHPTARLGLQVFGMQHAFALGDLQTADGQVQDVIGNRWSLGAAVVIR